MLQKAYKENIPFIGPEGESLSDVIFDVYVQYWQVIRRAGTSFHQ